ncbi:MAG TPA: DUF1579 domain-containing protein [Chitinophagaceae bacterium]|nr:DUF1579 domain-containing protein [Chitinophagaceae bacterium]
MKRILLTCLSVSVILYACSNEKKKEEGNKDETKTESTETNNTSTAPPDSAAQAEMMKAWQDFATPGPEHSWMNGHAGTWVCDSVAQWMDPAQPPTYSKATDVVTVAMNGLYQMSDFSSNMMGMEMKGHGIMGFDKMKKKFVLSWIDNLGSGIVRMEGTYDESSKTLTMTGKQSDPGMKKETDMRQVMKFHEDDSYTMTMYGTGHDGKEAKFMEGAFKRVKK